MNNGLIIDGVLALLLLIGFLIGAKRGLFKSLMGFVVVIAALFTAAIAADKLTEPITDVVLPAVEEKVSAWLAMPEDMTMDDFAEGETSPDSLTSDGFFPWQEKLEQWGGGDRFFGHLQERAANAAQIAVRSLVESVVHAVLLLLCFLIVLVILKLLTNLIDHVFELPGLHALNTVGGGIFGFLEVLLLIYLVLWIAPSLGITFFREQESHTFLLAFFANNSPYTLIASLNGGN